MSTTETLSKSSSGRRIRIFSQILKALVLIYLVGLPLVTLAVPALVDFLEVHFVLLPGQTIGHINSAASQPEVAPSTKIIGALATTVYLIAAMVFYRLLNLYEKGAIFSPAHVRLFRLLGFLAIGKGVLTIAGTLLPLDRYGLGLVLFFILHSAWMVGGFFGIMLACIMDEGCKLKEEQELTV
ncbi:MAG: DUF2975 domain-containing protein [Verrucomicrobiae bacterium]|nr:DUF2975 domain-containing protein [Verrucomicrobiae bacterium]